MWRNDLRGVWMKLLAIVLLALGAGSAALGADAVPRRIVSLNLCTDQLLVELVAPERIAGVSLLGSDRSLSASAAALATFPKLSGSAEEVLALKPDLVIAGEFTTGATVELLRRLGQKVLIVPLATDFEGMRQTLRLIASAVGEQERGEAIISDFDARLRSARSTVPSRPTAIAYQVNSLVSGPQSLLDAALDAAGYRNLARDLKLGPAGRLPLEQLVATPPDLVVLANAPSDFQTVLADNLRHPALADLLRRRPSVHLPMPYWMCATPKLAVAVEILASMKSTGFAEAAAQADRAP